MDAFHQSPVKSEKPQIQNNSGRFSLCEKLLLLGNLRIREGFFHMGFGGERYGV